MEPSRSSLLRCVFTFVALVLALPPAGAATGTPIAVTTYHYNSLRTGWNNLETQLSAASFPANFGVLATVAVDDQVDAQPLLLPAQTIAGGTHDVLYVVTEHNTVYALDAQTGAGHAEPRGSGAHATRLRQQRPQCRHHRYADHR